MAVSISRKPKRRQKPGVSESGVPLYRRIAEGLKKDILSGVYPVGSQLPTEAELCEHYDVSRYTVREALRKLRDDDMVTSRPRAGTIVISRRSTGTYAQDVMSIQELVTWSAGKRIEIDSMEMITLDRELAESIGLVVGDQWLQVLGYGYTEGVECPHCWAEYYIHRDFAGVGRLLQRHKGPIFPLIEDLYGQIVVEVQHEISATLISRKLAESLRVEAGSAGLSVRRAFKTSDGKVAQVTRSIHPASSYRHSMTLRRVEN